MVGSVQPRCLFASQGNGVVQVKMKPRKKQRLTASHHRGAGCELQFQSKRKCLQLTFPFIERAYRYVWSAAELQARMRLAVGLRQCIRPLVESMTPGLDGHPLAFAPIKWTASVETFSDIRFRKRGIDPLPSLSSQANRKELFL